MTEIKSSTHEDLEFDSEAMSSIFEETDCWLVALDDWEIALVLSSLRYAHFSRRWRNLGDHTWDEIEASITQLEHCLMAGCNVGELLDKFDTLNETLTTLAGRFVTPEDKCIAEVVEDLELTCGDTTVNFDTASLVTAIGAVGDDIEAQTTMQETRSIAEVTAQNTNFDDLITAVEALELVANCAPDVNVDCPPPEVNVTVQGGGGGCIGEGDGTTMPHDPGTIGDDPPEGYDDYDPVIVDELRCKFANATVDELVNALQGFIDGGILWTIKVGGYIAAGIISLVFALTAPGVLILSFAAKDIVGFITDIVKALVQLEDADLASLINILTENEEEFVCILYNVQDGDSVLDIKAAFNEALLAHEATVAQRILMDAFLAADVLNNLYWQPTWALNGKTVEEWLDGYEGSVDCGDCGSGCSHYFELEDEYLQGNGPFNLSSVLAQSFPTEYHVIQICWHGDRSDIPTSYCGPNVKVNITNIVGQTDPPPALNFYRFWYFDDDIVDIYHSNTQQNSNLCHRLISLCSGTAFTCTITITEDCP
jgi:hypothetical protein